MERSGRPSRAVVSEMKNRTHGNPRFRLLTTREAAAAAGVSAACIRQWVKRGYLRPTARYQRGNGLLYREDHVLEVERDRRAAITPSRSRRGGVSSSN